jgi:riboflavin synthase
VFTGIIRGVGQIVEQAEVQGDRRVTIQADDTALPVLVEGASVAVNGVCLTVIDPRSGRFSADVSIETLSVTTFADLGVGSGVNYEPALRMGDALDGHLLTGHIDGIGRVSAIRESARSIVIEIRIPADLARYVARKGAISVDGVSLTVNTVGENVFEVNIIPHTQEKTIISTYRVGTAVNIEVDVVARYVERLTIGGDTSASISLETLQEHGYTNKN